MSVAPPAASAPPAQGAPATPSFTLPIKDIYLHLEYLVGVGGAVYPTYEPYILLPDGTITDDLSYYPVAETDIEHWRSLAPPPVGSLDGKR